MPFAAVGMALNGAIVPAIQLVRSKVKHPAWQMTAKGLTGLVLLPTMWATETTIAYRRFGGRAALAVAAAGPDRRDGVDRVARPLAALAPHRREPRVVPSPGRGARRGACQP